MTSSDDAAEAWTAATDGVEGSEEQSSEDNPKGSDGQSPLPDWINWLLPEQSDKHDTDGRTGVLSTRTEVHAIVIGVTVGAHVALTGDMQLINDIVGLGIAGDRARQAKKIPEKYQDQAKEELPYFIAGVVIGIGAARSDVLVDIPLGV